MNLETVSNIFHHPLVQKRHLTIYTDIFSCVFLDGTFSNHPNGNILPYIPLYIYIHILIYSILPHLPRLFTSVNHPPKTGSILTSGCVTARFPRRRGLQPSFGSWPCALLSWDSKLAVHSSEDGTFSGKPAVFFGKVLVKLNSNSFFAFSP